MVSVDGGRENVWAISDYTGVLEKNTQLAGRCWGGVKNSSTIKIQAVEAANLAGICRYGKKGRGIKIFHSMFKYNDFFVAKNFFGKVISFMGDCPLEESPWIFKITRDKSWAWPDVKLLSNPIEMQTHFIQG